MTTNKRCLHCGVVTGRRTTRHKPGCNRPRCRWDAVRDISRLKRELGSCDVPYEPPGFDPEDDFAEWSDCYE